MACQRRVRRHINGAAFKFVRGKRRLGVMCFRFVFRGRTLSGTNCLLKRNFVLGIVRQLLKQMP